MKKKDRLVEISLACASLCFVLGLVYGPYHAYKEHEEQKHAEPRRCKRDRFEELPELEHNRQVRQQSEALLLENGKTNDTRKFMKRDDGEWFLLGKMASKNF